MVKNKSYLVALLFSFILAPGLSSAADIKILAISAALHKNSGPEKLVDFVVQAQKSKNITFEKIQIKNYITIPLDLDLIKKDGIPKPIQQLAEKIISSDAIIISTPEYNGSFPGHLKTVLDLVSIQNKDAFNFKPILLLSTSSGRFGGLKGIIQLQQPLFSMGAIVYPKLVAIQSHDKGFKEDDTSRLLSVLDDFYDYIRRNKAECAQN